MTEPLDTLLSMYIEVITEKFEDEDFFNDVITQLALRKTASITLVNNGTIILNLVATNDVNLHDSASVFYVFAVEGYPQYNYIVTGTYDSWMGPHFTPAQRVPEQVYAHNQQVSQLIWTSSPEPSTQTIGDQYKLPDIFLPG